ncbi:caspase family protein [Mesorhizobium sp. VNQ89]|uniref:caspase family protein n=1 Tax=Mesorhizobium quangtriensis TaxID=3157709 RepID=UPI0032B859E0
MKTWIKGRGLLAATALAVVASGFAAPAWARTNYAVLMAVTAYPNLPPKNALIGPNHDAKLVRDYLTTAAPIKFEADDVTVLADDLDGATLSPTRANILATLKDIADKAERDDFVYLHYSGHGSQQPTKTPETETDGMDEILLPSDSRPWDKQAEAIPNALVDDEIGAALDAIRDKGAFVWLVVDACNSGAVTRAAAVQLDSDEAERKLEPTDPEGLGIPQAAIAEAVAGASAAAGQQDRLRFMSEEENRALQTGDQSATSAEQITKGGLVAFMAAQTVETTPEMPLPKGVEGATRYGLFTYTIFSKLAENPNMTYRQLGHSVLQQYGADARQRPTPIFEGELDARVFGSEKIDAVMQWQVDTKDGSITLPAGSLHRLTPGTKLAILPSPASELSETRGYLEVTSVENFSSKARPVAYEDKPALTIANFPTNAYARLSELAVDYQLRVARPSASAGLEEDVKLANEMLDKLAGAKDKRFNIEFVEPGAEADIRLGVFPESDVEGAPADASKEAALWFLPASGEVSLANGRRPPLIYINRSEPDRLSKLANENLQKIFRATALSRLSVASGEVPQDVKVSFQIKRAKGGGKEDLVAAAVPTVQPGDQVHIVAENNSRGIVDINVLYLGSDYSISHMDAQRLVVGAKIDEPLLAFTDQTFGTERMIAVITEAPPLSEVEDLSFLEQGKVPSATRSASVGRDTAGPSDFASALTDIGLAPATRSVVKLKDQSGPKNAVMIFPIETAPLN